MRHPYFLLHLAIFLAGFTGVFGKLITLNEGLLTGYRVLFSAIALFLILYFAKTPHPEKSSDRVAIGGVGMLLAIHWVLFYGSIKYANISVGVVCFALSGFFTALLAPLVNRKPVQVSEVLIGLITVVGIGLIFHFDITHQTGIILGVISSVFSALYTIFNEKLVQKFDIKVINFYQMLAGVLGIAIFLPFYLWQFPTSYWFPNFRDLIYLLILSLVCTVGLYMLFAEALKSIPAFTVNLSFNLEPVYSIILAFVFFSEAKELNVYFFIGLFLVMFSVVLQSVFTQYKKRQSLNNPAV